LAPQKVPIQIAAGRAAKPVIADYRFWNPKHISCHALAVATTIEEPGHGLATGGLVFVACTALILRLRSAGAKSSAFPETSMSTPKLAPDIVLRQETPQDHDIIEALGAVAFGPGRFSRAAFRLREGVASEPTLCFVACIEDRLVGSVKLTRIMIGDKPALVLGPLMVDPTMRNLGIGRELMNRSIHVARQEGHRFITLVGDHAYYKPFGFERVPHGDITYPGPADPQRILALELVQGVAVEYRGQTRKWIGETGQ